MKSQRRHELQRNTLDLELGRVLEWFKKHGNRVAWGVLIAVVIGLGIFLLVNRSHARQRELQSQYDQLTSGGNMTFEEALAGFRNLADQDDNERLAALACVQVGNMLSMQRLSLTNPVEIADCVKQAETYFRRATAYGDIPDAAAAGYFGLGMLAESRRDFDAANREYRSAATTGGVGSPVTWYAQIAMQRLEDETEPVRMATSAPATQPTTQSATQPAGEKEPEMADLPNS